MPQRLAGQDPRRLPVFKGDFTRGSMFQNEHVWQAGWAEIMKEGLTPQTAAEKAFKRVEEIFAKYPIG